MSVHKKSREEIKLMRHAGNVVALVHQEMAKIIEPGVSTKFLDEAAAKIIKENKCIPTFLGYNGFPATICASVNSQVVHGIPSENCILKEGDIISIDVGATYHGLVGDGAWTYPVGNISDECKMLLETTERSLMAGISKMRDGALLDDVSGAVEDVAKEKNLGIVRQYGGHGVGHHTTGVGRILHIVIDVQDHGKGLFAGVVGHTAPLFNLSELACSQAEAEDEQSQYLVIRSHDVLLVLRSASLFREFLLGTLDHLGGDVDGDTGHEAEHHHSGHAVDEASVGGEVGLYQLEDNGAQAAEDGQAEGCADAVALDVLCGNCANLGANGSTDEHDKSGNQFGTPLQGVGGSAVQAGDGNFKEVGADCDVGRAANEVHQGGHTDEAAADAEDTGENASEEGHADGEPCGAVDAGLMEVDHRGDLDGVELGSPVKAGGLFVKDFALGSGFAFLLLAQGHVMEDHPGHEDEQDNVEPADNLIDAAEAFELHDYLGADFHADHGTDKHGQTELVVDVAEAAVTHGGNERFTSHVSHVGTNGEGHRETKDVQAGGNHPGAAHAEEAADDADTKTQDDEAGPENGAAGNGHQNIQPVHNVPPYSAAFLCLRSMPM